MANNEDFASLKVAELRAELKKRHLRVSGSKDELLARLRSGDNDGEAKGDEDSEGLRSSKGKRRSAAAEENDDEEVKDASHARKTKLDDAELDEEDEPPKKKPALLKRSSSNTSASLGSWIPPETDFTVPVKAPGEWKIVCWNVASYNSIQLKGLKSYLDSEQADIVCFNETKIDEALVAEDSVPGYKAYFHSCAATPGYSGVGVLAKVAPKKVTKGIGVPVHDSEGRVITLEYPGFYLVAAYWPNSGQSKRADGLPANLAYRLEWDVAFEKYMADLDQVKPVILAGDLNVAHQEIDLTNPKPNQKNAGFTQEERDSFTRLLARGFTDTYRAQHPDEVDCYTFWSYRAVSRPRNIGWRVDYFIASNRIAPKVTQTFIRKYVLGSDHCPLGINLKVDEL